MREGGEHISWKPSHLAFHIHEWRGTRVCASGTRRLSGRPVPRRRSRGASIPVDPRPSLSRMPNLFMRRPSSVEMTPIGQVVAIQGTTWDVNLLSQPTAGSAAQEGAIVLASHIPRETLRDLDGFSHVWIIASLHLNTGWKPLIKPPRGPRNVKRGLFSTRAPHRPNQISLSAVEIVGVDVDAGRVTIRGLDLIDGTPILDMKPYVAYCDSFPIHAPVGSMSLTAQPTDLTV